MKSQSHFQTILITLATSTLLHAQGDTTSRPGLTLGTLVNLDLGGIPPADLTVDDVPVQLTDAELSIGLRLRPDLSVQTVLVHEDGSAKVDQAYATWESHWLELSFGKQTLPMGLYPSHLIHDPLLQQDLETIVPSLMASKASGAFGCHVAVAGQSREVTEIVSDSSFRQVATAYPLVVASLDAKWGEEGLARLSTRIAHHSRTASLGAQIPLGPFSLDLEGMATDGAWNDADLAGLAWTPVDALELAVRCDARKAHDTGRWSRQAAAGATLRFADLAYTGAEWLQDLDGDGAVTLRMGLEGEFSLR